MTGEMKKRFFEIFSAYTRLGLDHRVVIDKSFYHFIMEEKTFRSSCIILDKVKHLIYED